MAEKHNDGGPAFPAAMESESHFQEGMSLRDWLAGQALAGYIANPDTANSNSQTIARDCYHIADAFLAERSKAEGRS